MTNIHHVAAEGFALGAASYVAGRPDYPPEIEDWLTQDLGLDQRQNSIGSRSRYREVFAQAVSNRGARNCR